MQPQLLKVLNQHKDVIKNLMQFYMYDFSEFINMDVETDGLFQAYKNLDDYWNDKNRFPYIIQQNEKYAGFVLVRLIETTTHTYFSMAQFFVMKKYRRNGVGKSIAAQILIYIKANGKCFKKKLINLRNYSGRKLLNVIQKAKLLLYVLQATKQIFVIKSLEKDALKNDHPRILKPALNNELIFPTWYKRYLTVPGFEKKYVVVFYHL